MNPTVEPRTLPRIPYFGDPRETKLVVLSHVVCQMDRTKGKTGTNLCTRRFRKAGS